MGVFSVLFSAYDRDSFDQLVSQQTGYETIKKWGKDSLYKFDPLVSCLNNSGSPQQFPKQMEPVTGSHSQLLLNFNEDEEVLDEVPVNTSLTV